MNAPALRHLTWNVGRGRKPVQEGKSLCGIALPITEMLQVMHALLTAHGGDLDPATLCLACRAAWVDYKLFKVRPVERKSRCVECYELKVDPDEFADGLRCTVCVEKALCA